MNRFRWIIYVLVIVVLLVAAEIAIIANVSGYNIKKKVVFARVKIPENTVITGDMLEVREIGIDLVHPDALVSADEAVSMRAAVDIERGEMMLKAKISPEARAAIEAEDKNKRLFSMELKADQANAWQFSGNQYVDIIFVPGHTDENDQVPEAAGVADASPASTGVKILKNIRVAGLIDEDGKTIDLSEHGNMPKYVSLEVTEAQAVFLAYAKNSGKIELSCIPDK